MFLLISVAIPSVGNGTYFNTSHVSINLLRQAEQKQKEPNFNTSHVSINPHRFRRTMATNVYFNTSHVSINLQWSHTLRQSTKISIHPMFLLINSQGLNTSYPKSISIHPMFLLIVPDKSFRLVMFKFQYIPCFY